MKMPQPIPYQGSKRNIARAILAFFPTKINTVVEPFAGSAAVSVAAAARGKAFRFHLNDINKPLMDLWSRIINNPTWIADSYERLWKEQKGQERDFYDFVRSQFNKTKRADYFLYLLARCVKASVRYNSKGEFNQSPDNRRRGRDPQKMRGDILAVSALLKGKTKITSKDYKKVLATISEGDLVYMDPPYQGVCSGRDPRYYGAVDFDEFIKQLQTLAQNNIWFIVSYDGRRGSDKYGRDLPPYIGYRIEINAGRSAQSTLLGENKITHESLYLSEALLKSLDIPPSKLPKRYSLSGQPITLPLETYAGYE